MNDLIENFLNATIRKPIDQEYRESHDDGHKMGFSRAAGITIRGIQDKLDGFIEQMKSSGLSKTDQLLYAHLQELKTELETNFDKYWRGSHFDWRPQKPIAKGHIKNSEIIEGEEKEL